MKAEFVKIQRQDPDAKDFNYTDCSLSKDTVFCCEVFNKFCKKFPSWNYQLGRFTIVDQITYESNTQIPINYCPFCGEKIKYKELKKKKSSS